MMSNYQNVTEGLRILTGVLAPYVAGELRARFGEAWWEQGVLGVLYEQQKRDLPARGDDEELTRSLDAAQCLILMDVQWNDWFRRKLDREHRTWVKELIATRNRWAHSGLVDTADEDAWRALDTMTRLVEQMDSEATESLRTLARTVRYGTEGPSTDAGEVRDDAPRALARGGVLTDVPRQGLRPWREIVQPHPDVAAGRYRQAEFAADLSQVHRGTADVEYQDPVEFFARTYLTEGMRGLLVQALRRVGGHGGEPVIQLKTAFGGGKTHSLLALFHLLRGRVPPARLRNVAPLLDEAGLRAVPPVRVAVIVGTALNPARERRPPGKGLAIKTLWGEIGAQLAEQAGKPKLYDHVRAADRKSVPPGSESLRALFDECGPCLILIDELVAYARKIHGVDGLPAGTFDAVQTFVQELTEAVRASRDTVLVATIPESDIEVGGEAGQATLERIEHTLGRMEAIWKPVGSEEGFEVVRRRLFLPLEDTPARDDVCRAFSMLYRDGAGEFPSECRETRYLDRLKSSYPIHPELFERLYTDWSTLDRFQRTRGVLRLMAAVIHDLWSRSDAGLLIMPGSLGLDSVNVREELTRYLPEGWTSVLESDIDGRNSGPWRVDGDNPRFGQAVAARRVARSIFLGSAPHVVQQQVRGVEDVRVRLATVQPGEQVSVFNDALSQLSDRLTYLYRKDRRYWYDTRPNLRRTVEERALQFPEEDIDAEIERRVREASRRGRGDLRGVHVCPPESADVPDEPRARLVVLQPTAVHRRGAADSAALGASADILENRGTAPRQHRNMLMFLAPDDEAMDGLKQEARRFLAWQSVDRDRDALNLDANQRREAAEGHKTSDGNVAIRFAETWRWLLVPAQTVSDGQVGELEFEAIGADGGEDSIVARAARRLRAGDHIIPAWSPALLKMELDRWFWQDRDHVSVKAVWEALSAYCYLPRLLDEGVYAETVRAGVASGDYFGFAASVAENGRYEGLAIGEGVTVHVDAASVLVKPEAARAQIEAAPPTPGSEAGQVEDERQPYDAPPPSEKGQPTPTLPRRFFATVAINPDRAGRDMGDIAEEVLQNLTTLPGAKVRVTVEIEGEFPEGVPGDVQRVVGENCGTMRFKAHGFEEG
ncbi:MAG: ATP-binding protein [Gammaproteobacteria bacterium]|nr:ATP-binding protein [Gammaproteobacteria bacterium]